MCDKQFFRPWKEEEVCNGLGAQKDVVKCEPKEQEDDERSMKSSSPELHCRSMTPEGSEDSNTWDGTVRRETQPLDLLNQLVNKKIDSSKPSSCDSREDPTLESSLRRISNVQRISQEHFSLNPQLNFPNSSAFHPVMPPNNLLDIQNPFSTFPYTSNFINPSDFLSVGPYTTMEDAVNFIQQQDIAARQMKKMRPKKFKCEHCNVAFSNNGQLKGHIRIHTGERPFKCDNEGCGKSFTRNEELTRHKRIHTGVRPHACVYCGKRFGRKDHLKKHTRTHENRGPFAFGPPLSSYTYLQPIVSHSYYPPL